MGQAEYVNHHLSQRPDAGGNMRMAIIFELDVEVAEIQPGNSVKVESPVNQKRGGLWGMPMADLRKLAIVPSPNKGEKERRVALRERSKAVKVCVLRRAGEKCEGCDRDAPFNGKKIVRIWSRII
jgi:hypothetical protein